MEQSESNLQADATALPGVLHTLQGITAPQARYQSLLTDCESALQQAQAFLDTTDTTVGAPFNATVSGVSLLQAASALMSTHPEEVSAAASTVFQVYDGELNQTTDLQNRLQSEANQLQTDLLTP